jgi:vacuolar protein sorting-associated protein 45
MLNEVPGRKALIMDDETLIDVSVVMSKTNILRQEVFLICNLKSLPQENLSHLKAVVFCRCTQENINLLSDALKQPKFSQYFIYFSNKVQPKLLNNLAQADV